MKKSSALLAQWIEQWTLKKELSLWNIKKIISKGEYNYALVPEHPDATKHGYVLEHRIVMENHLGRLLNTNEAVHHLDGDKKNNSLNNLKLLTFL